MSREEYEEKLKAQNYVCYICKQPETSVNANTGTLKRLAVDHCHKASKIRDLLCWRCNSVLGKVNENIELLENFIKYIKEHKD